MHKPYIIIRMKVNLILISLWYQKRKKVKASYTRYQALGLELFPVYRQSAHR